MKCLLLAPLVSLGLLAPIFSKAETIPGISDKSAKFIGPEKITFTCPRKTRLNEDGKIEKMRTTLYPECWIVFHKDYMNVMDKQIIKRSNVLRLYFHEEHPYDIWYFIYKTSSGEEKLLPFKVKDRLGAESVRHWRKTRSVLQNWMAQ